MDIVVAKGTAILELLASKDQALLVRGNAFLVLNLGLDIVNRVSRLDLKGDGLARQGLDEAVVCTSAIFISISLHFATSRFGTTGRRLVHNLHLHCRKVSNYS